MIKKLLAKLLGKVVKNDVAADMIADKIDDVIMDVADKHTDGLASKAEAVVKAKKARRRAKK